VTRSPLPGTPRVEARDLSINVAGTEVVRGVTLALAPGEILGVLGPTGAGKSTLFRALVGEVIPDRGTVFLEGKDVTREPLWRRARLGIGYVPQTPTVLVDLTVRENVDTFERLVTRPGPDRRGVPYWADRLDLSHRLDVRAGQLSGGERRRLELARALIARPRVLVCDEPFAGIDPVGAERIGVLLKGEAAAGVAVLFADHHVAEALDICDRALLLLDGRVELTASPDQFREHPLVQGRYLGTWHRSIPPSRRETR
jgi:lipopolysaccharide export system ATP-binding protein